MMNNNIKVVAQGFYGNRTETEVNRENLDRFILGYIDDNIAVTEKIDRTIINIPNADNIVIVYNKYQEENKRNKKEELFKKENYELKPLVVIPENNIKLYSRCVVCRINEHGELESLRDDDYKKIVNYLAE